ncbi:MAG: hypothetical protein IJ583_17755 [Firmicutes bacterium]|nr:hypothetical protein [Bacillota bacterium]
MIRDKIIIFDKKRTEADVFRIFRNICHFGDEENDMTKYAEKTAREVYDELQVKAVISEFSSECIKDKYFEIGKNIFEVDMPTDIKKSHGLFSYIMTAGKIRERENIFEKFCADALGTAYISYGRKILGEYLGEFSGDVISESIAPGYYSMKTEDVKLIFDISDGNKIGVSVNESGMMIPEKSCAGFFIKGIKIGKKECEKCECKNCEYCI